MCRPNGPKPAWVRPLRSGPDRPADLGPDQRGVRQVEKRLRDRGVAIHHDGLVAHKPGAKSGGVYFFDPDGIRLEVNASSGFGEHDAPSGEQPTCGFF